MIGNIDLDNKSYEQILEESIAQIPIYSREWTNYNVSDPGITILENLSAFSALMQSEINDVPEHTRFKLLELAGFKPRKGKNAYAYIALDEDTKDMDYLPNGTKLYAHDICFEFENNYGKKIKNLKIKEIKSSGTDEEDLNDLISPEGVKGGLLLNDFTLYLNDIPEINEKAAIYFEMENLFNRNIFIDGSDNPFARIKWEINTVNGFRELKVEDGTYCFMKSGYVKFDIGEDIYYDMLNLDEHIIRVIFEKADYDITPRFRRICGVLTRVIQRDTRSFVEIIGKGENIAPNAILENGYQEIYRLGDGIDKSISVCRDVSVMAYRELGRLYGYDEQILELPPIERVCADDFSIMLVENVKNDEPTCHIVFPDTISEGEVYYSVIESENKIIVHDCGKYEGARVMLGNYSVYLGHLADMLPNAELGINEKKTKFTSYGKGERGYYSESFEEVRERFAHDIKTPVTMVTKEDCIKVVNSVPGLSIHKIGVSTNTDKNEIRVVVKPNSLERFPMLSDTYIDIIKNYLEEYRMLTTTVIIEQPVYVPINVSGTIYTKKYLKNSRSNIEGVLNEMLDGVDSDVGFGSRIVYHEIYEKLGLQECVADIASLTIFPDNYKYVELSGLDIKLSSNALFYLGDVNIEIIEI